MGVKVYTFAYLKAISLHTRILLSSGSNKMFNPLKKKSVITFLFHTFILLRRKLIFLRKLIVEI